MKKFISALAVFFIFSTINFFSQETLKSTEEEYYDFLSLIGIVERPTLGYRTLSDSEWIFIEETNDNSENDDTTRDYPNHPWKDNFLGTKHVLLEGKEGQNWFTRGIDSSLKLKIYGPDWYNSFNSAAPYGQNDGALWQGRGYNTSLTAGLRLEAFGFEATIKPQLCFSQNMEFDLMDNSKYYTNEYAYVWGYGSNKGCDAPQRFGDTPFFIYDWGDTEIRWSWKKFTFGFGTQSIWLGPAWLNPLLHSNNAPTYPKFDIGLRKTKVHVPYFGWYLGDIEGRFWIGRTSESDYFDEDDSNDHNQITGMYFSYAPSIFPGLTLGITKICMSKWDDDEFYKYLNPFYGMAGAGTDNEGEDQKFSFTADWISPKGGIDVYAEIGIDDHINMEDSFRGYVSHIWHTMTYTFGLKKEVPLGKRPDIRGEVICEWNNTEMTQDFQSEWPYNFGFHHQITQGYTNKGQWIGSGMGYGGQSQYFRMNVYYPKGKTGCFIQRANIDSNYINKEYISAPATDTYQGLRELHYRTYDYYKGVFSVGVDSLYFITKDFNISGGVTYSLIVNPHYEKSESHYAVWHNVHMFVGLKKAF